MSLSAIFVIARVMETVLAERKAIVFNTAAVVERRAVIVSDIHDSY